jgi:hypothetical protein
MTHPQSDAVYAALERGTHSTYREHLVTLRRSSLTRTSDHNRMLGVPIQNMRSEKAKRPSMSFYVRAVKSLGGVFAVLGTMACGEHVVVGGDPDRDGGGADATTTSGVGGTGGDAGASGASGGASGASGGASGASGGAGGEPGGSGGTAGSNGGGAGGSNPTDGGVCYAACGTPAGTVQAFSSNIEVYAALVGSWQICSGGGKVFANAPEDTRGIEFGPPGEKGGDVYYLVQGASGLERGAGFDYQLTYDVSQSGSFLQLNLHPTPNSGFAPSFRFSPCPTQWQMGAMYGSDKVILVPNL